MLATELGDAGVVGCWRRQQRMGFGKRSGPQTTGHGANHDLAIVRDGEMVEISGPEIGRTDRGDYCGVSEEG